MQKLVFALALIIFVSLFQLTSVLTYQHQRSIQLPHPDLANDNYLVRRKRDAEINITALEELDSSEDCGKATRVSACRLLEAHKIGYVWLWPVALGTPSAKATPLQTATTKASALNNVIDLCSGNKATAPYGNNLKFCVCSNVLDTIYNYAADQIFFSLPVYSLTVLDSTVCSDEMPEPTTPKSPRTSATGPILPLGMTAPPPLAPRAAGATGPMLPLGHPNAATTMAPDEDLSLMELPGFHTIDFSCGFANDGSFSGAVSICAQIAQFCASAITKYQFVVASMSNYSIAELPSIGVIEMLPFTEYQCGRKYPQQFSIRCTIPCSYTI